MPPGLPLEPVLELVGVFVGGLSGALAAIRKQFDIFGIGRWEFIVTACLAGVTMYFFHPRLERARRMIAVLDAGALALFTVVGTVKGLSLGAGTTAAVCVGVITGVGGGVLRDLLTGEVPVVLHHRQLYAIPAVIGASVTVALWSTSSLSTLTVGLAVGLVLGASPCRDAVPPERPRTVAGQGARGLRPVSSRRAAVASHSVASHSGGSGRMVA